MYFPKLVTDIWSLEKSQLVLPFLNNMNIAMIFISPLKYDRKYASASKLLLVSQSVITVSMAICFVVSSACVICPHHLPASIYSYSSPFAGYALRNLITISQCVCENPNCFCWTNICIMVVELGLRTHDAAMMTSFGHSF